MSTATPHSLSKPEELRKQANEILKGVDQLIKAGSLAQAQSEISRAKSIDPNNAYIYAFEERISFLRAEDQRKQGDAAARAQKEDEAKARLEAERKRLEEERKAREEESKRKLEADRLKKAQAQAPAPAAKPAGLTDRQKAELEAKRKFEEDFKKAESDRQKAAKPVVSNDANDPANIYKKVLLLAWADGALTKEEQSQLSAMRATLNISDEIHQRLEADVKLESYAQAFKIAWTSGLNAKDRGSVVAELRRKFSIASTEHAKVESKVLAELGPDHHQQSIVIVDDEDAMRMLIAQVLEESGFVVQAFATSDEAIVALKDLKPDMILSDINLDTSTMGGFSFYEKVRLYQHLAMVPFMFLSGLKDEGMIRYGKGLGADDYLTKPFSNDLLVDTIRGKIKRYRQMRPQAVATS
ncbi:MAG: response regulator [Bacteroidetes bacterium]|jgi:CheY-like chemotaxis protein|nr:response regulator [Bacteroidota bacterium]